MKDIRGPPSHSFWLGSEKVHQNAKQVGDLEFQWAREYGPTWMTKGCLGEEILWTADPRALQYVFHTSGYRFSKRTTAIETTRLFTGESILTADSVDHQRHRKIMNPAFGAAQLRTFLPVFRRSAARLSQKWKDMIQLGEKSDGCTINVNETLSRMTLDVIGEVAFDYRFGVLDDNGVDNELVQAFNNLFIDTLLYQSSWDIIFSICLTESTAVSRHTCKQPFKQEGLSSMKRRLIPKRAVRTSSVFSYSQTLWKMHELS